MSTVFKLTIVNEKKNLHHSIDVNENTTILEAAANSDIILPSLCGSGECYSCMCKLVSGSVKHINSNILTEKDLDEGYILACSAYLTSDSLIETHKEKEFARYKKGI